MTKQIPSLGWKNEKRADDYKCATFAVDKEKWIQVYKGATFVAGEEKWVEDDKCATFVAGRRKCVRVGEGATFAVGQEKCVTVYECATFDREIVSLVVSRVHELSRHETMHGCTQHISALAFTRLTSGLLVLFWCQNPQK
uniref:C-type lectin domain-containing protein n=1 Tax=Panagrellus redivivus TaxID=6233 RepID=A0A7E4VW95_PANRE